MSSSQSIFSKIPSQNQSAILFDSNQYNELLRLGGWMQFHQEPPDKPEFLHLDQLHATNKGNGYGMAAMRRLVEQSLSAGLEGNIETGASYSSHIFYLYMGMAPYDKNYVIANYGFFGQSLLDKLSGEAPPLDPFEFSLLSLMLRKEKGIAADKPVTPDDVLADKEFLLALRTKPYYAVSPHFINTLIALLGSESNQNVKFPDTANWGMQKMHLSEEGKRRWKNAIDQKIEFKPFKNFEHLTPFMTPEQRTQLDQIVEQRNKTFAKQQPSQGNTVLTEKKP